MPSGQWRSQYRIKKPHKARLSIVLEGYYQTGRAGGCLRRDSTDRTFKNIFGLKEILLSDHQQGRVQLFAKKFFEYANGYQPDFDQRIALHGMIPDKASECRLRDLCHRYFSTH